MLYYFRKTLHLRCVAGLLIRFFEKYKDLITIVLRERKKIVGGFMEYLLSVHRPNKLQGILLCINSVNIKRIHFSHLNKTCLT